jgi:hypothetical protein
VPRIAAGLIAISASGCLARSLAIDTQPVVVVWTTAEGVTLGCDEGRVDLPLMRIRTHLQQSPSDDDEYFDWMPCRSENTFELPAFQGVTTPLELGSYDVEVELWTADRTQRIAVQNGARTAILNEPAVPYTVEVELRPDPAFVRHAQVPPDIPPR